MATRIVTLVGEYKSLREQISNLRLLDAGRDEVVDRLESRMSDIVVELSHTPSNTEMELVCKASVLLDWLDPLHGDFRDHLAGSVCADILEMLPGKREP